MSLPDGFVTLRAGVVVRRGFEAELERVLRAAAGAPESQRPAQHGDGSSAAATPAAGRGTTRRVALADGGGAFVRRYVHGGLLGAVLGDRYWERPPRPIAELVATEAARAAGVVAPEVLAAVAAPAAPGGVVYRAWLVTRELAGRRALGAALASAGSADERRAWLASAVRAVRRLHAAGIGHPDLNVANLLVGARPEDDAAVIDFDRARVAPRPVGALGTALARRRLARSIAKLGLPGLDRAGAARTLDALGLGAPP